MPLNKETKRNHKLGIHVQCQPDQWSSCCPFKSNWTTKLQYSNQLQLHILHNQCFWLLQRPYPYLPNPSVRARYDTRSIFKRSLAGLNSEFSFSETSCLTKAEEPSLSYYLPIDGEIIIRFITFPRVLVLCELQLAWSWIWTRIAMSTSYDDNYYITDASLSFSFKS